MELVIRPYWEDNGFGLSINFYVDLRQNLILKCNLKRPLIWTDKNIQQIKTQIRKTKRKKAAQREMSAIVPNI